MKTFGILAAALMLAAGVVPGPAAAAAPQPSGAAEIVLEGGTSGDVAFPHRRHQEKLGDCNICHSAYPQKVRAIEELKEQGALKKKQIMDTQCTRCHKEKKSAGENSGPTTCTTCHVKK
jgi:c(7)-type cytochrome triheme protein